MHTLRCATIECPLALGVFKGGNLGEVNEKQELGSLSNGDENVISNDKFRLLQSLLFQLF